jgi:WD40 repeat protein
LVLIGAPASHPNSSDHGQAFLFDANTGELLFTIDDPTPTTHDFFGMSVAIEGDLILIGDARDDTSARNVGQAHLFSASTGQLLRTLEDPTRGPWDFDGFGESVSLEDGLALIGAPYDGSTSNAVGQAHLFDALTGVLLQTFADPTPTTSDEFGGVVVLDEGRVLISARGDDTQQLDVGQAHLFRPVPEPTALALVLWSFAMFRSIGGPRIRT